MVNYFEIFGIEDIASLPELVFGGGKDKLLGISKLVFGTNKLWSQGYLWSAWSMVIDWKRFPHNAVSNRMDRLWKISEILTWIWKRPPSRQVEQQQQPAGRVFQHLHVPFLNSWKLLLTLTINSLNIKQTSTVFTNEEIVSISDIIERIQRFFSWGLTWSLDWDSIQYHFILRWQPMLKTEQLNEQVTW